MLGAITGDIIGSRFERLNLKSKNFSLFTQNDRFTDDTVLTVAVCDALLLCDGDYTGLSQNAVGSMRRFGRKYINSGFSRQTRGWILSDDMGAYGSCRNGAAMRVSGCGYAGSSIDEVKELSRKVTEITHSHPDGIKGAEAVAIATFMARCGESMDSIREYICRNYYNIDFTLDEIRPTYEFDVTCEGSVPQAFEAFFESVSYEDCIRNAVSIGGDSDTIAAMAGSIAEAYYGMPREIRETVKDYLDTPLLSVVREFEKKYPPKIID